MNWDKRFMEMAHLVSTWSKDRSRKTGCVIVGFDHEVRSIGFNGFPRNVDDDMESRHQRPAKYLWTEHAERNAIYNAARMGVSLEGCTIYIMWYPCADCARAIIQSGIHEIVAYEPDWNDPKWADDFSMVKELLQESGILIRFMDGKSPKMIGQSQID